jgi:hypothetical protein
MCCKTFHLLFPDTQQPTDSWIANRPHARHIREVEAESVALICCETLGLEGADFCRVYIQHWLKAEKEIPNHTGAHIFAAATSILKAGTPLRTTSRLPVLRSLANHYYRTDRERRGFRCCGDHSAESFIFSLVLSSVRRLRRRVDSTGDSFVHRKGTSRYILRTHSDSP